MLSDIRKRGVLVYMEICTCVYLTLDRSLEVHAIVSNLSIYVNEKSVASA